MLLSARWSVIARQRRGANVVGGLALGEDRQPSDVGQRRHGAVRRRVVRRAEGRKRQKPIGGAVARFRVGIRRGDASERRRVGNPGGRGPPDARVRVELGEDGQLGRILEFAHGFESDGRVSVLPTWLRLELVEKSHGEYWPSYKKGTCRESQRPTL